MPKFGRNPVIKFLLINMRKEIFPNDNKNIYIYIYSKGKQWILSPKNGVLMALRLIILILDLLILIFLQNVKAPLINISDK